MPGEQPPPTPAALPEPCLPRIYGRSQPVRESLAHALRLILAQESDLGCARQWLIQALLSTFCQPERPERAYQRLFPDAPRLGNPALWSHLSGLCRFFSWTEADLGPLYEQLLAIEDPRTPAGATRATRKSGGCYYTPPALARAMATTLLAFLTERNRHLQRGLSLLDPAMGGGVFLCAAAKALLDAGPPSASSWVWRALYGVDCDPQAVLTARLSLWALAGGRARAGPPLGFMTDRLCVGDALLTAMGRQFDGILGNPPYLGVKQGLCPQARAAYARAFITATGQYDLYGLFIERSLALLTPGGVLGFLLPKPLLVNDHQRPVRDLLLGRRLLAVWEVGKDAFSPQAAVENVALFVANDPAPPDNPVIVCQWDRHAGQPLARQSASQAAMASLPEKPINLWLTPARQAFLQVMERHSLPLSALLADAPQGRGEELGKNHCTRLRTTPQARPVLTGQDIQAFELPQTPAFYLGPPTPGAPERKSPALYGTPRLLIRRVADRPIAAVDEATGWLTLNTIYNVHLQNPAWLPLVCALLNSPPVRAWFRLRYYFNEALFPYLRQQQILAIPIPLAERLEAPCGESHTIRQEFIFLYEQLASPSLDMTTRTALHERLLAAACRAYGVTPNDDWLTL